MDLPPPRPISPSPGGQPALTDIVGRDDDVGRIWRALAESSSSILITAPRRIGKTRTMELLCARAPEGWDAVIYSLQGVGTLVGLAEALLTMIHRHQRLRDRVWDRVTPFLHGGATVAYGDVAFTLAAPFRDDPVAAVTRILDAVDANLGDDHLLLVCDEMPDMLDAIRRSEGEDAARQALGVFRTWRDARSDATSTSSIRWLVTGSVGLHHVLRAVGGRDDLANDLHRLPLGPLDPEWSAWLAESLLLGAGISAPDPTAVQRLAATSDGFAMVLHLVAAQVRDRQIRALSEAEVDPLVDEVFRNLGASDQLAAFLRRVPDLYGTDSQLAHRILDRLILGPLSRPDLLTDDPSHDVPADEEHLRLVLGWLTMDHYIEHDDTGPTRIYRWRYPVLARLWREQRR